MRTLVIVDMQDGFTVSGHDDVLAAVCDLVRHAKTRDWAIVALEFERFGGTRPEILRAVGDYYRYATCAKYRPDGSTEVVYESRYRDFPLSFVVCGVYTSCCVFDTVDGLIEKGFPVTVVRSACKDSWGVPDGDGVSPFTRLEFLAKMKPLKLEMHETITGVLEAA